jgi:uncharacterized membrane protein
MEFSTTLHMFDLDCIFLLKIDKSSMKTSSSSDSLVTFNSFYYQISDKSKLIKIQSGRVFHALSEYLLFCYNLFQCFK